MIKPRTFYEWLVGASDSGRVRVDSVQNGLVWVVALETGSTFTHTDGYLLMNAKELPIAIGQTWAWVGPSHVFGMPTTITIVDCRLVGQGYRWTYHRNDNGCTDTLSEELLLKWYARVDGLSPAFAPAGITFANDKCPRCEEPAFVMTRTAECTSSKCTLYNANVRRKP